MRTARDSAAAAAVWALLAAALFYLAWPIWRAQFSLEIDGNEPWNAFLADAAFGAGPLYPPPDGLTGNNYTPLSFYILGGLQRLGGDALYWGRYLSILSTIGIGATVYTLVRMWGGTRASGAVAGLWFIATMSAFFPIYVGLNDPHLLGLAVMCAAFVWFFHLWRTGRAVEPAILLMVFSGFIKHTLIAPPLTALIFLAFEDWRRALRAAIAGAAASVAGLLLCYAAYGPDFFGDLLLPRITSVEQSINSIGRLQFIMPALAIGGVWAWFDWANPAAKLFVNLALTTGISNFLQKLGVGVDDNAGFELTVAAAFGFGMAFARLPELLPIKRWTAEQTRWCLLAIVAVRLLLTTNMEPFALALSPQFRAAVAAHAAVAQAEAKRVAALPDQKVYCSLGMICRMAGKPYVVDGFKQQTFIWMGLFSDADFAERLRREGIRREEVDWRGSYYSITLKLFSLAPAE
jgi:hypothetical protein